MVQLAARGRSWLVGVKGLIDDSLGQIVARKLIYANQIGEGRTVQVVDDLWRAEGAITNDGDGLESRPRPAAMAVFSSFMHAEMPSFAIISPWCWEGEAACGAAANLPWL